mgnify:CR=1 FL=1
MKMEPKKVQLKKDFKAIQQDQTELNGDGNRDRGRYGEDLSTSKKKVDEHGYDEDGMQYKGYSPFKGTDWETGETIFA